MTLLRALPTRAALLLTGALVLSVVGVPEAATAASPPAPAAALHGPATVTLLTGERVTLRPGKDGKPQVDVRSRDGRSGTSGYSVRNDHGRISVVPHDVQSLVPDVLDPALFDVTGLVEMRYDDAHRADLPVIVRDAGGTRTMASGGFVATRALASVDATAGRIQKSSAGTFGTALTASSLTKPAKIWLDGAVRGDSTVVPDRVLRPPVLRPPVLRQHPSTGFWRRSKRPPPGRVDSTARASRSRSWTPESIPGTRRWPAR